MVNTWTWWRWCLQCCHLWQSNCESSLGLREWMWASARWPPACWPSPQTWHLSPPVGCYRPNIRPSPVVSLLNHESDIHILSHVGWKAEFTLELMTLLVLYTVLPLLLVGWCWVVPMSELWPKQGGQSWNSSWNICSVFHLNWLRLVSPIASLV